MNINIKQLLKKYGSKQAYFVTQSLSVKIKIIQWRQVTGPVVGVVKGYYFSISLQDLLNTLAIQIF